jgi:hypothetical protein
MQVLTSSGGGLVLPSFDSLKATVSRWLSLDGFEEAERMLGVLCPGGRHEEGELVVITCLNPACLECREVESTAARDTGACPSCHSLGWAEPIDLARDERWWIEHPLPEPRLAGEELRDALTRAGLGVAEPSIYVVEVVPPPSHLISNGDIDAALDATHGPRR